MVKVPRPFPYESQRTVPWDYNCNYTHQTTVNDLTSVGGITQSGRCYAPSLAKKVAPEQLSVLVNEEERRLFKEKKGKDKEVPKGTSKPIIEKEANEFLKFIKHSEYSVIEQLNKTLARISLLALFQNSKVHHSVLLNALSETYVNPTIIVEGIDQLVGNITVGVSIAFTD